jgi:hypothetical protein
MGLCDSRPEFCVTVSRLARMRVRISHTRLRSILTLSSRSNKRADQL